MALYIQWDEVNQTHVGVPSNVPGETGIWLKCQPPATPRKAEGQTLKWLYLEGTHEDYLSGYWDGSDDPLDAPANITQIKEAQERFEHYPIDVFGTVIDCDSRSEQFMKDALETWEVRDVLPGVFDDVDGARVVHWKASDNTTSPLTKEQLNSVYQQMRINRAARAQSLWAKAQLYKANGCSLRTISSIENFLAD